MKTLNPYKLFSFLILMMVLLIETDLQATHLVGGSLNYEYLGENPDGSYRYRIYSVTFTDCGPTSNFLDPEAAIPVAIYENDLDNPSNDKTLITEFTMPLVSFEEVVLAGIPDGCDVGSDVCVEQGNYEFFVDLPLNFDGYWIYYDRCCRNNAVVNLQELQGVGMSTYIPSPLIVNSSPYFNAPPTPFLCVGDTTSFLNSAIDPDGDLMVFSFINPFRGFGDQNNPNPGAAGYQDPIPWEVPTANYNPGFAVNEPFGNDGYAFINGATGLTQYMVPNAGQYSVAIEIKEYRNGNLIGIVRRDLQLTVINCPVNPAPVLDEASEGNVGFTDWQIDEGDTLCFPVIFTDENGDSLTITSFGEVFDPGLVSPSATITAPPIAEGTIQADFCWETDCNQGQDVPYLFQVTSSDNGCPPKSQSLVYLIEVVPFTGATFLDGEDNVCANSTETYSTDEIDDGEYAWSVTGGTILSGQNTPEVTIEWGPAGNGTLSVTSTNYRDCVGNPFDLNVAIVPLPVISAGSDISICPGDTVEIGGAPTGPDGSFYIWGPTTSMEGNNTANPSVFPSETTSYGVQVLSAASCSAVDTVVVTVFEPQLDVTADQEICDGQSAQLLAFNAASYTWIPDTGLDNPNVPDPIATPDNTTTYTVFGFDNNSCAVEDSITVTVFEQPIAMAGVDQTVCALQTQMEALPSSGIGEWTVSTGGMVISNLPNTMGSAMNEGIYTFTWSESTGNGLCMSQDDVIITFIDQPEADAGAGGSICGLEFELEATPSIGAAEWTLPTGLTISPDINSSAATLTAETFGAYTITWTETNQICTDSEEITIEFFETPISNAGLSASICGDSYVLAADPSVGTGMWSGSDDVAFDDASSPTSNVTSDTFTAQELTWTETNGVCTSEESITVTFIENPDTDAGDDLTICGLEIDAAAIPSVGNSSWSLVPGVSIADVTDPQTGLTANAYDTYTFTWTEDNNGCVDSDQMTVAFLEVPVAEAGQDEAICIDSSVQLSATGGDSYDWSPTTGLDNADIASPEASPEETTTYTVQVSLDNGCSTSDNVTVTVNSLPVIDAGDDISYLCFGDSVQLAATPGFVGYSWSPSTGISDNSISNPYVGPLPQSAIILNYEVTVTDTNDCENSDIVTVTINPDVPTNAGMDTLICQGEPVLLGAFPVAPAGSTYTWSPNSDIDDVNAEHPTVNPSVTTTYTVVTDNSICTGTDQVTVMVESTPELGFDISANPSCTGLDLTFYNTSDGDLSYLWSFGDGDSSTVESPSHLYGFNAQYEVTLTATSELGCTYETSQVLDASDFGSYFDLRTPNVMTPNGDGENDELSINIAGQIEECLQMQVFNRWGQLLFEATGNNTKWDGYTKDGQLVEPGVYFYYVEFNGTSHKGSVQVLY